MQLKWIFKMGLFSYRLFSYILSFLSLQKILRLHLLFLLCSCEDYKLAFFLRKKK